MAKRFEYAKIFDTFIGLIGDHMRYVIYFSFPSYTVDFIDILDENGVDHIRKILEVVGTDSWESLRGRYVWVETEGFGSSPTAIRGVSTDKRLSLQDLLYDH